MAGESPDRAEQQGSSEGKTTASSSTVASASASSDRVDQPTAVFKTLTPRTPEDDAVPEPSPEAPSEAASGGSAAGGAVPEDRAESERLKDAVAAWVASADRKAPGESETSGEPETSGDGGEDEGRGAESAADSEGDEADSRDEADEADETSQSGDSEDEADDGDEADGGDAPAAAEASDESWFAPRKPAASAPEPEPKSEPKSEPRPEAGPAAGPEAGGAPAAPKAEEPVDQPTTMFRAVRPPAAPVVDQPTTALKLPPRTAEPTPAPGAAGRAGADTGSDSDTDSESERTSTFVPLRPDIPAEQKPKATPAASGPAASGPAAPAPAAASAGPAASAPATPSAALSEPERTRQQPLPPLPPLDLLAELTNTPPPPPTPLRTTLRRIRIWTPLVLLLLIIFAIVQMVRPLPAPTLKLSASPTYTFEGGALQMPWPGEGQGAVEVEGVGSMGTYGAQKPAPIASVTKTMTAYVILRDHPIKGGDEGPEITVDQKAADQAKAVHESTAPVKKGQKYSEKELLQLLMIPSANNVARLLARWDAGSEQAFVDKMNAAAKDLGMTQSRYTDPSGLLDSTVSTPRDQLKLAKAVMQYDVFREIVNMPNATIEGVGYIENNNSRLLLKPGVSGIKTGSSTPAGGNLLWSANTVVDGKNRRILGIVMGAQNADQLSKKLELSLDYSYELIKKAQDDVTSAAVVKKGQVLGYVDDGLGGRTPVVATKELKAVGWPGLKVKLELTDGGKAVPHTGRAGDIVGQVSIGEGAGKVSAPVALKADLVEPGFDKKLTRVG